jgi:NTP pyrophosphatase (non-canonical NTP hydrolase)
MITNDLIIDMIKGHCERAQERYGDFASSHEALGVALEEFNELQSAVHANDLKAVAEEAIDVAAVMVRLALQCWTSKALQERSQK